VTTFKRLFGLTAGQRRWIAVGALLGFLAVGSNVALMAVSAFLISKAAIVSNVAEVALAITAVRVLAIGRAAFRYFERTVTHRATFAILADLRVWFFASIEPLAPARLAARRSGDLLTRIVGDIETLEDFYVRVVLPPIVAGLVTLFAALGLGMLDVTLGLTLAGFLVASGIVLPLVSRRLSRAPGAAAIATRGEFSATLVDEINGLADLVALDRAAAHRDRVLALGTELDAAGERLALVRSATTATSSMLAGLAGVTVLAVGIGLVGAGRLDPILLAAIPLVAVASFEVIGPLAQAFGSWDTNKAAAERLFELTDAPPEVSDPALAGVRAGTPAQSTVHAPLTAPGIEIRDLCFRYGPDEPFVIDGLDLSVAPGTSLAIVGPSGSGKSTIVNLLLRFWEYHEGEIRIDGRDIRDDRAEDVRRLLGVVPQDVHLFDATIRDNLAVADADVTDERIEAACRLAQVHAFIETLPKGYETRVGENGVLLSGGERQRLAIARAIIKDAPILILDEATANLDVGTEAALLDSLAPFIATRTTIVISHRMSVASRTDRLLVLDG
jgi:ATP-binding cassette subfamily C protein CydC